MGRNPVPQRFQQLDSWALAHGAAEHASTWADHKSATRIANIKESEQ
jgi:hypothetical protein